MKFIVGKKLEMTQIWKDDKVVAVTKVQAGPCVVTQVKTDEADKYKAVQVGFGSRKEKNIKKPQLGHLKSFSKDSKNFRYLREFRLDIKGKEDATAFKVGDSVNVETFEEGDKVDVTSTSKGKGFQGVVKRHGFHGSKKTHGNKDQHRMPGSIGATGPAHVFKGTRMGGRMGGDQVTTKNLTIVGIDIENNILLVKGAISGAINSLVEIKGHGEIKVIEAPKQEEVKVEETKVEIPKVEEVKKDASKEAKSSDA